ncbi:putative protein involved in outer membrane biogenesis [Limihaloglobus sulfuriphilus]|uniref:Uncharacterized protein n=1 Tax=Limihaloglobus sulfuriphilus TaxID=1851148 RepID=A0A1Q2ME87_9BACT|nr:hypothetical protein [Limihaloglobus sulfuriphilus]AQQ70572.1 putative protein involved in outer membrane biogenesis [Limihaloglobus sulfuriphilus]
MVKALYVLLGFIVVVILAALAFSPKVAQIAADRLRQSVAEKTGYQLNVSSTYYHLPSTVEFTDMALYDGQGNRKCVIDSLYAEIRLMPALLGRLRLRDIKIKGVGLDLSPKAETRDTPIKFQLDNFETSAGDIKTRICNYLEVLPQFYIEDASVTVEQPDGDTGKFNLEYVSCDRNLLTDNLSMSCKFTEEGLLAATELEADVKIDDDCLTASVWGSLTNTGYSLAGNDWRLDKLRLNTQINSEKISLTGSFGSSDISKCSGSFGAEVDFSENLAFKINTDLTNLILTQQPVCNALYYNPENSGKYFGFFGDMLARYQPQGSVDISFDASAAIDNKEKTLSVSIFKQLLSALDIQGKMKLKGISVYYVEFPYELDDVTADVWISNNSGGLNNLKGFHNDVLIEISADTSLDAESGGWTTRAKVTSPNMLLEPDLYFALPGEVQASWDKFEPSGRISLEYNMIEGPGNPNDSRLEAELLGVEACYNKYPYTLKNITGRAAVDNGRITMDNLTAADSRGKICINGLVDSKAGEYDIEIDCENLWMDQEFKNLVPVLKDKTFALSADSYTDLSLIYISSPGKEPVSQTALSIYSENISYRDFTLDNVQAVLVIRGSEILVRKIHGDLDGGPVSIRGRLNPDSEADFRPWDFEYDIRDVSAEVYESINAEKFPIVDFLNNLNPKGRITAAGRISMPEIPAENLFIDSSFSFDKMNINNQYDISNAAGSLFLDNGGLDISDLNFSFIINPETVIPVSVTKATKDLNLDKSPLRFDLKSSGIDLAGLGDAGIFQGGDNLFVTGGVFDINLHECVLKSNGSENLLTFAGVVLGKGVQGDNFSSDQIGLTGSAEYSFLNGFHMVDMTGTAGEFEYKSIPLANSSFDLKMAPDKREFKLNNFSASFGGGSLAADILFPYRDKNKYTFSVNFDKVQVGRLNNKITAGLPQFMLNFDGTAGGNLYIEGVKADGESRKGRLNVSIGSITAEEETLFTMITGGLGALASFDDKFDMLQFESYIKGSRIEMSDIYLADQNYGFYGSGYMDTAGEELNIDLSVYLGRPGQQETGSKSLFNAFGSSIANVKVGGKFDNPTVNTKVMGIGVGL